MIISIQGVRGSFHDEATALIFPGAELLERGSFDEVFEDCVTGRSDYSLAAIENSIVGSLIYNYDRLFRYNLHIVGEVYLRISHCLIGLPGTSIDQIREVRSHPMAIEQCRRFLSTIPVKVVEAEDTAGSVQDLMASGNPQIAAIASARSADIYEAHILAPAIETDPHNYTRFLVLSNNPQKRPSSRAGTKTSLLVRIADEPGALYQLLADISKAGINLSKIESRPTVGTPWKYDFYLDLDLNIDSEQGKLLLSRLQETVLFLRVMGCYPKLGA